MKYAPSQRGDTYHIDLDDDLSMTGVLCRRHNNQIGGALESKIAPQLRALAEFQRPMLDVHEPVKMVGSNAVLELSVGLASRWMAKTLANIQWTHFDLRPEDAWVRYVFGAPLNPGGTFGLHCALVESDAPSMAAADTAGSFEYATVNGRSKSGAPDQVLGAGILIYRPGFGVMSLVFNLVASFPDHVLHRTVEEQTGRTYQWFRPNPADEFRLRLQRTGPEDFDNSRVVKFIT